MNDRIEDILKQLEEEKNIRETSDNNSMLGKTKQKFKAVEVLSTSTLAFLHLIWKIVYPFYAIFRYAILNTFWKYYKPIWNRFAYIGEKEDRHFSKVRGAVTLLSSLVFGWILYGFLFFVSDVVLYVATAHVDEMVYLSNAQEIDSLENIHSVQGCTVQSTGENFSCDSDKSLYFRIENNAFAEVWSILKHGTLFYPDYVAAPIAPGWQQCTVTSYGFRMKLFLRGFNIYPALLSAKCEQI
jgi:hypothetical protein